jgi:hypothetical protein
MSWLRPGETLASHHRDLGSVMGVFILVEEVALEEVHSEFLGFPLLITIPPLLTLIYHHPEVCDSPDQAPCYNILGLCVGGFTSIGIDWLEYGSSIFLEQKHTVT